MYIQYNKYHSHCIYIYAIDIDYCNNVLTNMYWKFESDDFKVLKFI